MKRSWLRMAVLLLLAAGGVLAVLLHEDRVFSVEYVRRNREAFLAMIGTHYLQSVACLILLYFATAFFLPGALALTVAGGLMFGTIEGAVYAVVGATGGAVAAFAAARSLFGAQMQRRFRKQLGRFNKEMEHHGPNYLLVLRLLPIAPFFVVNYGAAITRIPLKTFVWTTSLGMLPGALIHAFIGEQLRRADAASDLLSGKVVLALGLLALFAVAPVALHHLQQRGK